MIRGLQPPPTAGLIRSRMNQSSICIRVSLQVRTTPVMLRLVLSYHSAFLGNYLIQAETDVQCRIGYHLPDDFGTTDCAGAPIYRFRRDDKVHHAWGSMPCRRGANLVARNLVLDGNSFAKSRSTDKHLFCHQPRLASFWTQWFQATFSYVMWGKGVYGQKTREDYISGFSSLVTCT